MEKNPQKTISKKQLQEVQYVIVQCTLREDMYATDVIFLERCQGLVARASDGMVGVQI